MKLSDNKQSVKYALAFVLLLCCIGVKAQYATTVKVTDAPNNTLKEKIEKNGSLLLTELNNAQGENRSLSLRNFDIDILAASSLVTMWEVCPFRCDGLEVNERCLQTAFGGYQVRNIPVIMEPRSGEKYDEDRYQEIVINYDANGTISSVCFALNSTMYKQIMRNNLEVTDLRRRALVIDFVEQFRTAYNKKDTTFLRNIFSDDALIITGKVIERRSADGNIALKPEIKYNVQNKEEYLDRLKIVFERNPRINVVFEEVKVNKHRSRNNIYGVKLVQHWNSGTYKDKGYLFLLWDFQNEEEPKIHVRTWQPFEQTPVESVFELADFKIN